MADQNYLPGYIRLLYILLSFFYRNELKHKTNRATIDDSVLTAAMVDRLTHKAYVINMNGA